MREYLSRISEISIHLPHTYLHGSFRAGNPHLLLDTPEFQSTLGHDLIVNFSNPTGSHGWDKGH